MPPVMLTRRRSALRENSGVCRRGQSLRLAIASEAAFCPRPRTARASSATNKTGVADANGNYPDMGAYEFVETAASNLDMTVTSVIGPAAAMAGGQATVQWTVSNIGTGTVVGPWHDSVYLVRNPGPYQTELFAGQILVGQGVTLGPGQSYTTSAQVEVPGDVAGDHYWEVKTNSAGDIFEGQNTGNNTMVSPAPVTLDVPSLLIDGGAVSAQFTGVGDHRWFQFTPRRAKTSSSASIWPTLPGPPICTSAKVTCPIRNITTSRSRNGTQRP